MENSPSCPECISISFLCVPIFPWWWLYPPEAIPAAFLSPLSSQYLFDVKKAEDKVLVSLQQEDRRKYKKEGKGDNITIGFEIFKVGRVCSVCSTLTLRSLANTARIIPESGSNFVWALHSGHGSSAEFSSAPTLFGYISFIWNNFLPLSKEFQVLFLPPEFLEKSKITLILKIWRVFSPSSASISSANTSRWMKLKSLHFFCCHLGKKVFSKAGLESWKWIYGKRNPKR